MVSALSIVVEITGGLTGYSLEEDEWEAGRQLRDLRGRVMRARVVVANTPPGLAETLAKG